jgi:hypothetical protein
VTLVVLAKPITESAVDAIAAAVFAKSDPFVAEAYSEPDKEPRMFKSADDLANHIKEQIAAPRGSADIIVVYPDMGGRPVRRTIHLDPKHCPGQKLRYTWDGFGMISLQLYGSDQFRMSRICANSAARAQAWTPTYPEWTPPDGWNWKAVESHTRRLQRVFKKVT